MTEELQMALDALEEIAELETFEQLENAPVIAARAIREIRREQLLKV